MFAMLMITLSVSLGVITPNTNPHQKGTGSMIYLDISDTTQWVAHTDWLGNPAEEYGVSQEETALDFSVRNAGRGMKWSRHFRKPIDLTKMNYVMVVYRAEGIAGFGDYFLYLNVRAGDSSEEVYALMPGDLEDDGRWRTAVAKVPHAQLGWMAIQVQARTGEANIQIRSIAFTSEKPVFSLADKCLQFESERLHLLFVIPEFSNLSNAVVYEAEGRRVFQVDFTVLHNTISSSQVIGIAM